MIDFRSQAAPHLSPIPASGEREGPATREGEGQSAMAGHERTDIVTVAGEDGSLRLDRWFKRHYPALGHGHLEKLLRTGRIRVDGRRARSSDRVVAGQAICLDASL